MRLKPNLGFASNANKKLSPMYSYAPRHKNSKFLIVCIDYRITFISIMLTVVKLFYSYYAYYVYIIIYIYMYK